jgi:hypothetical protein
LPSDKYFIPYFSIVRAVGPGTIQERGTGCKVATMGIDFGSADAVQAMWEIAGREPRESSDAVTTSYDDAVVLTMVSRSADIHLNVDGTAYTGENIDVLGASFQMNNMLTPLTRYKIGSPYAISLDCLDREGNMSLVMEIDNDDLYSRVHYMPNGTWKEAPALGSYSVTAANSDAIPQSLRLRAGNVFFTGMMIANEPRRIVEAQLQAIAMRSQALQSVQFELLNKKASYE